MFGGVPQENLMSFYTTLAIALNAGAPLMQCLTAYQEQNDNKNFEKVLISIIKDVASGKPFSEALMKFPKIFPNDFQSLVAAGELSGQMDTLLVEYVEFAEGQAKLNSKFKGAMAYPAVMAAIAVGVTIMLTQVIFPKFILSLNLKEKDMPAITLYVSKFSNFCATNYIGIFIATIALSAAFWYVTQKTDKGGDAWDAILFNSPVIGDLLKKYYVSRMVHTLASQLRGGVPGMQALQICYNSIENRQFSKLVTDIMESIKSGGSYTDGLRKNTHIVPPIVILMFTIGEETGSMETVLEKIGSYYDDQVAVAVDAVIGLIEPLMIVVMGGIVTTLALSMFLPMFDMGKNIG
jgi:type IV pilus assembly protein PilC